MEAIYPAAPFQMYHVQVWGKRFFSICGTQGKQQESMVLTWVCQCSGTRVKIGLYEFFLFPTYLGSVYTTPKEFENTALFLRLGLPSTLIRHKNGGFRKRHSNQKNLKTPTFHFRVDGKHFENGAFENDGVTM